MMSDTDLLKLYSERVLALTTAIPHLGRLDAPQARVMKRSPLCGSTVSVDVVLGPDGRVSRFAQEVKACALGQASAAVAGAQMIGRSRGELEAARDQLKAMLAGGEVPAAPFDGYAVLEPARAYKNRHASIMLALEAALAATTEAEAKAA
jgi:NifU-like protein involved in Fe-S cluster formation